MARIGDRGEMEAFVPGEFERVVCASPQYVTRHGAPQSPDDGTVAFVPVNGAKRLNKAWP